MTKLVASGTAAGEEFSVSAERLASIASEHGTPVYVLDLDQLERNLLRLSAMLRPGRLLYSMKTNYLPEVTHVVHRLGLGVDVVSGYELRAAFRAGFGGDRIVFNGPVKSAEELCAAVDAGVFVNIDAEEEIDQLADLGGSRGADIAVGLRVFPADDVYSAPGSAQHRAIPSKFGWPIEDGDADRVARRIADTPGLRLAGIHVHLGSQITNELALLAAIRSVVGWVARSQQLARIENLNFGGGFSVPGIHRHSGGGNPSKLVAPPLAEPRSRPPDVAFSPSSLAQSVRKLLTERGLAHAQVCWEPGRAVISDCMVLLTQVAAVKDTRQGAWVVLNGGLNLLPTAGIYETHRFTALRPSIREESFRVAGPLCYEGDVLSLGTMLPKDIAKGDLVMIHDAGAYSITRATSFNRPRAAVVAVRGDDTHLCWRAETDEDIFGFAQSRPAGAASEPGL